MSKVSKGLRRSHSSEGTQEAHEYGALLRHQMAQLGYSGFGAIKRFTEAVGGREQSTFSGLVRGVHLPSSQTYQLIRQVLPNLPPPPPPPYSPRGEGKPAPAKVNGNSKVAISDAPVLSAEEAEEARLRAMLDLAWQGLCHADRIEILKLALDASFRKQVDA